MKWMALTACVGLMACETSTDPADGGFFNGVRGIASGDYQAQIDAEEADVAASRARNAELAAQIQSSEAQLAQLKATILSQSKSLGETDGATSNRISKVLASDPGGESDAKHLAALQQSIAEARALSEDLAKLSG